MCVCVRGVCFSRVRVAGGVALQNHAAMAYYRAFAGVGCSSFGKTRRLVALPDELNDVFSRVPRLIVLLQLSPHGVARQILCDACVYERAFYRRVTKNITFGRRCFVHRAWEYLEEGVLFYRMVSCPAFGSIIIRSAGMSNVE